MRWCCLENRWLMIGRRKYQIYFSNTLYTDEEGKQQGNEVKWACFLHVALVYHSDEPSLWMESVPLLQTRQCCSAAFLSSQIHEAFLVPGGLTEHNNVKRRLFSSPPRINEMKILTESSEDQLWWCPCLKGRTSHLTNIPLIHLACISLLSPFSLGHGTF